MSSTLQPLQEESSPTLRTQEFNTAKALELRFKGLTYEAIGAALCPDNPYTRQTVQEHVSRFLQLLDNPHALSAYEENRGKILSSLEFELLRSLADEEAIQKASLRDRTIAFGTIFDKRRLESGQSTSNLGVLTRHIQAVDGNLFDSQQEKKAAKPRMDSGD